jgi:hypothetical protein
LLGCEQKLISAFWLVSADHWFGQGFHGLPLLNVKLPAG